MPRSDLYPLFDRIHGGKFADRLRKARRDGKSYRTIALELHDEGLSVSDETIRVWCIEIDSERAS